MASTVYSTNVSVHCKETTCGVRAPPLPLTVCGDFEYLQDLHISGIKSLPEVRSQVWLLNAEFSSPDSTRRKEGVYLDILVYIVCIWCSPEAAHRLLAHRDRKIGSEDWNSSAFRLTRERTSVKCRHQQHFVSIAHLSHGDYYLSLRLLVDGQWRYRTIIVLGLDSTANEGPVKILYKYLVLINVFPEMKLLFPKQNYNVLSPISYTYTLYLWEIYIFPGSVCLFCCREICGPI